MSADEDTELRDLVAQTLESNGVLGKIRAQLRASVFLALEEQESVQNKTPFLNQDLKKFINTKEGRMVTGLVREFLEFFNLEFTLAVFEPETGFSEHYEGRSSLCQECNLGNPGGSSAPLLCEVLRRSSAERPGRAKLNSTDDSDGVCRIPQDLSTKQITEARRKFDQYDRDKSGLIEKDELRSLFCDIFPNFNKNMLDRYVNDEFKASDTDFSNAIDFEEFLGMYKRLFILCRSVVSHDVSDITSQSPRKYSDSSSSRIPAPVKKTNVNGTVEAKNKRNLENGSVSSRSRSTSLDEPPVPAKNMFNSTLDKNRQQTNALKNDINNLEEFSGSEPEDDPFFDDPLPNLDKAKTFNNRTNTKVDANSSTCSPARSVSFIPVPKSGSRIQVVEPMEESRQSFARRVKGSNRVSDRSKSSGIPKPTPSTPPSTNTNTLTSLSGLPPLSDKSNTAKDTSKSDPAGKSQSDLKEIDKRIADLGFDVPEDDYEDDFQSDGLTHSARTLSSARSEKSVTRTASMGEEIEEELDEEIEDIEEDISAADDFLKDSQSGFDDLTTDRTISPRQPGGFDYMEDVLVP